MPAECRKVKVETGSKSQIEATFCLTVVTMRDWNDGELCWIVLVVVIVGVAAQENPQWVINRTAVIKDNPQKAKDNPQTANDNPQKANDNPR